MRIALAENIRLDVGARQRVDLGLQVGQLTERIEVSAAATLLETDTSQRGQVITGEQTRALPLNGREYSSLALLTTGVRLSALNTGRLHAARGLVQRQRPAQHVQQLPDRRRGQQRLRHEQPGLLEPGDAAVARRRRRVQGRHQQHERRIRPLRRRHHQRRVRQRHQPRSAAAPGSSCATRRSTRPGSSSRPTARSRRSSAISSAASSAARSCATRRSSSPTTRASARCADWPPARRSPTLAQRQGILTVDVRNPLTGADLSGRHADPDDGVRAQGARRAAGADQQPARPTTTSCCSSSTT